MGGREPACLDVGEIAAVRVGREKVQERESAHRFAGIRRRRAAETGHVSEGILEFGYI
jgi:hypothetical protein